MFYKVKQDDPDCMEIILLQSYSDFSDFRYSSTKYL